MPLTLRGILKKYFQLSKYRSNNVITRETGILDNQFRVIYEGNVDICAYVYKASMIVEILTRPANSAPSAARLTGAIFSFSGILN